MKIALLANPWSGRGVGPERAECIAELLRRRGCSCEVVVGQSRQDSVNWGLHASRIADRLVVVGGDGTLNSVCEGISSQPLPAQLSLPPITMAALGTANLLAHEFKLPKKPALLADLIQTGTAQAMDLGHMQLQSTDGQTRHCESLLVWDFGLGAALMKRMDEVRQGPIRKSQYLLLMHQILRDWQPAPQRVIADGIDLGLFEYGVVSGIRTYAIPQFRFPPCAYDDGQWELFLFRKVNRRLVPRLALAAATGRLHRIPDSMLLKARHVVVEGARATPIQVDGDFVGYTPVEFHLPGYQLPVLHPGLQRSP
jgi:diacylglycerol kinase family enzyme